MDELKELEQEQRKLAKQQEELAEKIKSLQEAEFKRGRFYKSGNTIVLCTSPEGEHDCNFSGININDVEEYYFGEVDDGWVKDAFTEVIPDWRNV